MLEFTPPPTASHKVHLLSLQNPPALLRLWLWAGLLHTDPHKYLLVPAGQRPGEIQGGPECSKDSGTTGKLRAVYQAGSMRKEAGKG